MLFQFSQSLGLFLCAEAAVRSELAPKVASEKGDHGESYCRSGKRSLTRHVFPTLADSRGAVKESHMQHHAHLVHINTQAICHLEFEFHSLCLFLARFLPLSLSVSLSPLPSVSHLRSVSRTPALFFSQLTNKIQAPYSWVDCPSRETTLLVLSMICLSPSTE